MTNPSLNPIKLFAWVMVYDLFCRKEKIFLLLLAYFLILGTLLSV